MLLAVSVMFGFVVHTTGLDLDPTLNLLPNLAAVLACCGFAHWAEERVYAAMSSWRPPVRVVMTVLLAVMTPVVGFTFAGGLGAVMFALGDSGATLVGMVFGVLWFMSASVGSTLVRGVNSAANVVLPDFRSRMMLVIFVLASVVAVVAVGEALVGEAFVDYLRQHPADGALVWLGGGEMLEVTDANKDAISRLFAILYTAVSILVALPAVLSATGKLAEAMMERLEPLSRGFDVVSQGRFDVEVEEGGSRDFRELASNFNAMTRALGVAQGMERAFGVYVSPQVLARIQSQHGHMRIAASQREATVFFADLRGFTAMSENLLPEQVLGILNRYFEQVVTIINSREGYLDKFIGDAVIVVYNGPVDQEEHARRAVECALAIQREVQRLNDADAFPEVGHLAVGIGVATGALVAGNLGGQQQMEFTVIGDTVNLASRLTGIARPGEVLINARCAAALGEGWVLEPLEPVQVKGKAEPVSVFRVQDPGPEA